VQYNRVVRRAILVAIAGTAFGCSTPSDAPKPSASAGSPPAAQNTRTSVVSGRVGPSAIVELEPVGAELPLPEGPVIMDQYGKAFVPDLLLARAGQVVEFRNSEDIDHNVQVLRRPTGTTVLNESGSQGHMFRHTFEPGSYDVNCDIHPGMRAMIIASSTPYVAVADNRGEFTVSNVPSGRYTVKVTGDGHVKSQEVDVMGPRTVIAGSP